ncbi:MAG: LysR family transcriptional regulator [Rhodovulum sp.]|nr:LysR family transcriptional regulator [Rhodovulum sp.]
MEISLSHLRAFETLLRETSLTRAAHQLDLSQPQLSKILARLRAHFGDPLFVRTGRGMAPTARALEIAGAVRTILAASATLTPTPPAFAPARSERSFTLLITDVGTQRLAPHLMHRLDTEAPGVTIRIVPPDARHLHSMLESGEADIAVGAFPDLVQDIRRRRLFEEGYVAIVRGGHPFTAARPDRDTFLDAAHVLVQARQAGHAHANAEARLAEIVPRSRLRLSVPSFATAAMVVRRTDMVAVLPANLAKYLADALDLAIVETPSLGLGSVEISLLWHERFHRDPANRWLRRTLLAILGRGYRPGTEAARAAQEP